MDVDSAQYASLSREMRDTGAYLEVQLRGNDYLDKPPLLFWLSSLSFALFGVAPWSFKLLPLLSAFFAVYATAALGRLLYGPKAGFYAGLILGTCQAWFLFTLDLRTDTLLSAWVIGATWKLAAYQKNRRWADALWAGLFAGLAMLSKGPLGLMIPLLALGGSIVVEGRWKSLLRPGWYAGLGVALLCLIPMAWGLYHQFDLQPDKAVLMPTPHGLETRTGISGLRFFFWEQSFGRLTGENAWKDTSGPFFFVHNFLWAFMPWALFAVVALVWKMGREFRAWRAGTPTEGLVLSGLLLPFIALSASNYKLPHYIFPLFPFAALILGQFFAERARESKSRPLEAGLASVSWIVSISLSGVLLFWVFPSDIAVVVLSAIPFGLAVVYMLRARHYERWLWGAGLSSVGVNLVLSLQFYPQLLQYQAGTTLSEALVARAIPSEEVAYLSVHAYSFDFGMRAAIPVRPTLDDLHPSDRFVVVDESGLRSLREAGYELGTIIKRAHYPATQLSGAFLNPKSRSEVLKTWYAVELLRPPAVAKSRFPPPSSEPVAEATIEFRNPLELCPTPFERTP